MRLACLLLLGVVAIPAQGQVQLEDALGRALDRPAWVDAARTVYAERQGRPIWTTPEGLSERGRQLVEAIELATRDGLSPGTYLGPLPERQHDREAALTASLLSLSEHLMRGRADPTAVHRNWRAQRRRLNPEAALRLAFQRGPEASLHAARPPHPQYAKLRHARAALLSRGATSWPPLPSGSSLQLGDHGDPVVALRKRLVETGDLEASAQAGATFDAQLDAAVRRAQARHGLGADGVVGPKTRAALNVPPEARARQIALNMERWRWLPAQLGERHVWVDVPGYWVTLVDGGEPVWEARAIVGTPQTPTPGLSSTITDAVLNPYWNIPESIARSEIRPRLARDPGYLARHHMERLPGGALRQRPGPDNPLGPVKFIFDNPFGVRLHGTSNPGLFDRTDRAFSHGCVRVEDPLALADILLAAWDGDRILAALATESETWVALDAPLPIHVTYWTAHVDTEGVVHYRPDLYARDRALDRALGDLLP